MPKQKTYEHDYEWNGNAQPQKGVNIKEKNPWPTPVFASVQQPSNNNKKTISSTPVQAPTDIDELRQAHPWQKPQWATVDKSPNKNTSTTAVDRDAIPKPMLKKTPGGNTSTTNIITADNDAIAAMERKLAAAKQRQAELMQKGQAVASNETNETVAGREKHVSEETKLERARRLAKEKELERWRATLKERNERDKAQRHAAAGLVSHVLDDTAWQKPKEQPKPKPQQQQQEEMQQQRPEEVEKTVRQDEVAVVPAAGSISPIVVVQQHSVPEEEEPMLAVSPLSRRASLSRPAATTTTTTVDSSPRRPHHTKHDDEGDDDGVMEDPMAADLARQIAQLEWELQQLES
jgi:hypothetical protein